MWQQGEHVGIVGDTGSGKTFLESRLLPIRDYVVVFRTKSDDIHFSGFRRVTRVSSIVIEPNDRRSQWILDTSGFRNPSDKASRGAELIDKAWREHGWTIAIDELFYAEDKLKLTSDIETLLTQGRSLKVTVVCGMQRPARVSRFALSQITHLFAFRCEGRDVLTLSEAFTPRMKELIPQLEKHQFAYYNRSTRELMTGYAQDIERLM